jgi:hypothetical protein
MAKFLEKQLPYRKPAAVATHQALKLPYGPAIGVSLAESLRILL